MDDRGIPEGLGEDGRWFWSKAKAEREFTDAHDLARLAIAARILDEIRADQDLIEREGRYVHARLGRMIPHPAIKILQENRGLFIRAIQALGLDVVEEVGSQLKLY